MNTALQENGKLPENKLSFPVPTKFLAHLLSYLFHPLFIPTYVAAFLLFVHPYVFVGMDKKLKVFRFFSIVVNTALIPGFAVFLMWRLGFIQSVFLKTQRERIIPYAVSMIFYFWTWYVSLNQENDADAFTNFLSGSFITVIAAWLINIYFKISMHALAVGGMCFFIAWLTFYVEGSDPQYLLYAILIAGAVSTARLVISNHRPVEIYSGLLTGACCQLLAIWL